MWFDMTELIFWAAQDQGIAQYSLGCLLATPSSLSSILFIPTRLFSRWSEPQCSGELIPEQIRHAEPCPIHAAFETPPP